MPFFFFLFCYFLYQSNPLCHFSTNPYGSETISKEIVCRWLQHFLQYLWLTEACMKKTSKYSNFCKHLTFLISAFINLSINNLYLTNEVETENSTINRQSIKCHFLLFDLSICSKSIMPSVLKEVRLWQLPVTWAPGFFTFQSWVKSCYC